MAFQYSGGGYTGQPSGGGNPFHVKPGGDMLPGLQGISKSLAVIDKQRKEKAVKEKTEASYADIRKRMEAAQSMAPGDQANEYAALHSQYPAYSKWLESLTNVYTDAAGKQPHVQFARDALRDAHQDPDNGLAHIRRGAERVEAAGGNAQNLRNLESEWVANPALAEEQSGAVLSLHAPKEYAAMKAQRAEGRLDSAEARAGRKDAREAAGTWAPVADAPGVFHNKVTNETRVKPELESYLAKKVAAGGTLKPSELKGVDAVFETITKPVHAAHDAARALSILTDNATPSAQVAAVIQFIKALDPGSTVTQNEANQIVDNAGPVKGGLGGKWNKMLGEGGIRPEVMRDMRDTAQRLANSRMAEAQPRVDSKLRLYGPSLADHQKAEMGFLPDAFVIGGGTDNVETPTTQDDPLGIM